MRRYLCIIVCLIIAISSLSLVSCNEKKNETDEEKEIKKQTEITDTETEPFDFDTISDICETKDNKYEVAFICDIGSLKDLGYNQKIWEATKKYASVHRKTYKYYALENAEKSTYTDRLNAMNDACKNGAKIVICAGSAQGEAVVNSASAHPNVDFVWIDGNVCTDKDGNILQNVASLRFDEATSGYLAGYAAVSEGYTKLGFIGGGGGENEACVKYGLGFLKGASAAAEKKGVDADVKFSFKYGSTYSPSAELQAMLNGWYTTGTEVIFCAGGKMCESCFEAAKSNDKFVIGVDVDQSPLSETVLTSATKGLDTATESALDIFYTGKWASIGGKVITEFIYGGLPTENWKFRNFTLDDYKALNISLMSKSSLPTTPVNTAEYESETYNNLTVEYIK